MICRWFTISFQDISGDFTERLIFWLGRYIIAQRNHYKENECRGQDFSPCELFSNYLYLITIVYREIHGVSGCMWLIGSTRFHLHGMKSRSFGGYLQDSLSLAK